MTAELAAMKGADEPAGARVPRVRTALRLTWGKWERLRQFRSRSRCGHASGSVHFSGMSFRLLCDSCVFGWTNWFCSSRYAVTCMY